MSKMGRLAQEQQERERARTASIYQAEIESLVEEINKLKERLKVIEDSNKNENTIFTRVINGNTMTVSRPKENEGYVPLSFYVAIDERDNLRNRDLIYAASSKEELKNFKQLNGRRIFKVREVYEANGDV